MGWNARVVEAASRRMSSWTDCGWCLISVDLAERNRSLETDGEDESSMARSRP